MSFRPEILRYLHDCYREDHSRSVLWNLWGSATEHLIIRGGDEELLDGFISEAVLPNAKGRAAAETAAVYEKEKELVYAVFPIVGKIAASDGKTRQVCSPLITFPASINLDGDYAALSIEVENRRVNAGLLEALHSDPGEDSLADQIESILDGSSLNEADVGAIAKIVTESIEGLDSERMWKFPKLVEGKELRETLRNSRVGGQLKLLPSAAVCLIKRPVQARGVLTELTEIADSGMTSGPLVQLIAGAEAAPEQAPDEPVAIPAILSDSQHRILLAAREEELSVVIGPPGTGKSFTIAAIALDHLNRGESVLIGSKMNHAVDVIANKIEEQLGGCGKIVRAGRKHYMRELKSFVDQILIDPPGNEQETTAAITSLRLTLKGLKKKIAALEKTISRANQRQINWGRLAAKISGTEESLFAGLRWFFVRRKLENSPPIWELYEQWLEQLGQRSLVIAEWLRRMQEQRLQSGAREHWKELRALRKALGARTGTRQEKVFEEMDLDILFKTLPVWLTNLSDVHRVLPQKAELFDVVIIDEASQCDLASSLPLLHRAKRAVIVGDPKQLRHLSFVSRKQQGDAAAQHGLSDEDTKEFDYRARSLLDLATERISTGRGIHFLNEHFRSQPGIIRFSNARFYAEQLNVMTDRPRGTLPASVVHHRCDDGRRDADGRNLPEAETLLDAIESEIGLFKDGPTQPSIGVLSPFRAQVDHLADALRARFGAEIFSRHDLMVGTAHTFQGEERDLMFLSFAIDENSPAASRRFLEKNDIFNVAITRARQRQHVFTSIDAESLPGGSLLREYLGSIVAPESIGETSGVALLDRFASELKSELEDRGYQAWIGYPLAGLDIDLLVVNGTTTVALDLIGCPGPSAHIYPLERYRMFHRAGLNLMPMPYANWQLDRGRCLEEIEARLKK